MIVVSAGMGGEPAHASSTYYKYWIGSTETTYDGQGSCIRTEVTVNPNYQYCYYYSFSDSLSDAFADQLYLFRKQAGVGSEPQVISSRKSYYYTEGPRWTPSIKLQKKVCDVYVDEYETATNRFLGRKVIPDAYTIYLPSITWY